MTFYLCLIKYRDHLAPFVHGKWFSYLDRMLVRSDGGRSVLQTRLIARVLLFVVLHSGDANCLTTTKSSSLICSCDRQQRQTASNECKFYSKNYCERSDENCCYSMNYYVAFKHGQACTRIHSTELQVCRNNFLSK